MSLSPEISIDIFPAWARLNDVDFINAKLQETEGKGFGLVAAKDLRDELEEKENGNEGEIKDGKDPKAPAAPTATTPTNPTKLLRIPHDLVLSAASVKGYANVDQNFRQLLDAARHQSTRRDILLYLLTHLIRPRLDPAFSKGCVPTPWTEYIKFLPRYIPVPTMWTEVERALLQGTSLEVALNAKFSTLRNEFDELREKSSELPFWNALFWEKETATIDDWVLVDAWYRSRCLELPRAGDAMVPGLDMVNHSAVPTAYYEEDNQDDIVLLLRPDPGVSCGEEITISYGERKPAAEMLFSYGFVDPESAGQELVLPLKPLSDDPLGRAKVHISNSIPSVKISRTDGKLKWESPFAYLMVLNEEDGLDFRVLQDTDGERQLRLFWLEEDVTDRSDQFETLIQQHTLCSVFKLRAVAVLEELVSAQLARLEDSGFTHDELTSLRAAGQLREECILAVEALRAAEVSLLEEVAEVWEIQKTHLLADDHVVAYLGSMEAAQDGQAPEPAANDAEEFS